MIDSLTLKYFKRHTDLTVSFQGGLTALKGENEAGKTTLYQAIAYAIGGARALPQTLEETVTYDMPPSKLKVILNFTFEGVKGVIERSKSGAKVTYGDVVANGQSEVTKFMERLLSINMDVAGKLMIASQGKLRGALESGEAIALIEQLANISLIDDLIRKVQDQRSCGSTKAVEVAIEELSSRKEPVLDITSLLADEAATKDRLSALQVELDEIPDSASLILGLHSQASQIRRDQIECNNLSKQVAEVKAKLADSPIWSTYPPVDELRAKLDAARQVIELRAAYAEFKRLPKPVEAHKSSDDPTLEAGRLNAFIRITDKAIGNLKGTLRVAQSILITETACGLCGKDLSDVPEVISKNEATRRKITEHEAELCNLKLQLVAAEYDLAQVEEVRLSNERMSLAHAKLHKYTELSSTSPKVLTWVGGDVPETVEDTKALSALIAKAVAQSLEIKAHAAKREEWEIQLTGLEARLAKFAERDFNAEQADTASQLEVANNQTTKRKAVEDSIKAVSDSLRAVQYAIDLKTQLHHKAMSSFQEAQVSLGLVKDQLEEMQKNNALIRKLREVRPIVATRLWSVVLASVSTYFSQIRGEPTVISRNADGFLANSRPVAGLSGSTLDSLGLAMRMALSKTFLPSVDWLLLDEPGAGMSDTREAAMLGLLASANYGQVIVVTHSALADTFADHVVQV